MSTRKVKLKSKALLSRLGGISAFGFGASLKLPEAERTIVRELLIYLEDRRALYVGCIWEQLEHVALSVQDISTEPTSTLKRLGEDSPACGTDQQQTRPPVFLQDANDTRFAELASLHRLSPRLENRLTQIGDLAEEQVSS